jgi:hypothetical protein
MPSPEEQKDIDQLIKDQNEIKIKTFDYLRDIQRYSPDSLMHSGYRNMTNAQAMEKVFLSSLNDLKKVEKAFLKKWPDEK